MEDETIQTTATTTNQTTTQAGNDDYELPQYHLRRPNNFWAEYDDGMFSAQQDVMYQTIVNNSRLPEEFYNLHNFTTSDTIEEEQPKKELNMKSRSRNKALAEWSISARALKELVSSIVRIGDEAESDEFCTVYKFGAIYNPRYKRWYVYNKGANNNIATIKVSNKNIIVRYRKNSFYSTVLSDINVEGFKSMIVASSNLNRHNRILGRYIEHINNNRDGQMQFRNERKREHDRKHNK